AGGRKPTAGSDRVTRCERRPRRHGSGHGRAAPRLRQPRTPAGTHRSRSRFSRRPAMSATRRTQRVCGLPAALIAALASCTNDGSTSPLADVSTVEARRSAYDMLLRKGLIRVGLGIPKEAEFELVAVDDPYGFASAAELSLFRRPLPAANLEFLSGVMWDGRETLAGMSMRQDLAHQTNSATQGHAQKPDPLTDAQREEIVAFETGLFFAQ